MDYKKEAEMINLRALRVAPPPQRSLMTGD